MQQSQAEPKRSADAAMQKAEQAMGNAQAAMANAERSEKAAGDNALPGRLVLVPDGRGGQTRIFISGPDGINLLREGVSALAQEAPRSRKDVPDGVVDIMQVIATPAALAPEVAQRLAAIERAVDSVAVEVERISEGQRFTTKLRSERTKRDVERVL